MRGHRSAGNWTWIGRTSFGGASDGILSCDTLEFGENEISEGFAFAGVG
jgi:hypothetical protein